MKTTDELLFVVKNAQKQLPAEGDGRIADLLAFLEGMAPFIDKEFIVKTKCRTCDYYSSSFFPLEKDFDVVDYHEYCHDKEQPLHRLTMLSVAKCLSYTQESQFSMMRLAMSIVDEDLRPMIGDMKLYDRRSFSQSPVEFSIRCNEWVSIQLGRKQGDQFIEGDVKISIVSRLYPGFGAASARIEQAVRNGPALVVEANPAVRRQIDLDRIIDAVSKKRKMDIVYL
jgi:hypothetical protein